MIKVLVGDCLDKLRELPDESVHCCVTSPPYYGLRDYGTATWEGGDPECDHSTARRGHGTEKQSTSRGTSRDSLAGLSQCRQCGAIRKDDGIGLEATPEQHIAKLVEVFREVRRVLRKDGVLWLNYGDGYNANQGKGFNGNKRLDHASRNTVSARPEGAKPKDLLMMPARVALALQQDGWWLRSMMPWVKRSAMPESVTDRPATAIEYVFLLAKSGEALFWQHRDGGAVNVQPEPDYRWTHKDTKEERDTAPPGWVPGKKSKWQRANLWRGRDYYFDMEAVRSQAKRAGEIAGGNYAIKQSPLNGGAQQFLSGEVPAGRNFRNSDLFYASLEPPHGLICGDEPLALDVNPAAFSDAHFATFSPKLVEPLIKAATSEKGVCAECGAPWVREVERTLSNRRNSGRGENSDRNDGGKACNADRTAHTLGWSPSCACDAAVVPATILDCFGGAGTVGLVADRLKRNSILIELNPEYADMARKRIEGDSPLFANVT